MAYTIRTRISLKFMFVGLGVLFLPGFNFKTFATPTLKDSLVKEFGLLNSSSGINKTLDFFLAVQLYPSLKNKYGAFVYNDLFKDVSNQILKNGSGSQKLRFKFYECFYPKVLGDIDRIKQFTILGSSGEFRKLKEYALTLYNLKLCYYKSEQYDEIIEIIPKLYSENKKHGNFLNIAGGENYDMAKIFYEEKNYLEAIKYYRKYYEQNLKNNHFILAKLNNDMALCFYNNGIIDSASYYFNMAISKLNYIIINEKSEKKNYSYSEYFLNIVESNKAAIWVQEGKYKEALPFFYKQLNGAKHFNENDFTIGAYYKIAEVKYYIKKPDEALRYLDTTINLLKHFPYNNYYRMALQLKAKCYLLKSNMPLSDWYFKRSQKFADSMEAIKEKYAYITVTAKYNSQLKEQELKEINQKIVIEKSTNRIQGLGLLSVCVILCLLLFYSIHLHKIKKRISKQNKIINESLNEKEILLKEIHHRVKNNLQIVSSLLYIQSQKINNPELDNLVEESQKYIESMSLVHKMLYQNNNLRVMPMQEYLEKLGNKILKSPVPHQITIEVEAQDIALSIDCSIPLGLMVSEMITNSMKYAFTNEKGKIKISILKLSGNEYDFYYRDNGKGLPVNFDHKNNDTLGFKLISMLAEEMNTDIKIDSTNGLCIHLKFKDRYIKNES